MKWWYKYVAIFIAFLIVGMGFVLLAAIGGKTGPVDKISGFFMKIYTAVKKFAARFNEKFYSIFGVIQFNI